MALTACKETLYLTLRLLSPCQSLGFLFCRESFLIVSKALTDNTRLILSSFGLTDLSDRALDLSARLLDKALGFLLRFGMIRLRSSAMRVISSVYLLEASWRSFSSWRMLWRLLSQ